MTNFTKTKDWIFSNNRVIDYSTKALFFEIKKFFSDFHSSGFEIVASCNGTNSGPGDLINSVADVNSSSTPFRSWFVVKNNNHHNSIELLFTHGDTFGGLFGNVYYSNVGYSNFIDTNSPYAPDNSEDFTSNLSFDLGFPDTLNHPIVHYARTVDGRCSRLFLHQNSTLREAYFWEEKDLDTSSDPISYFVRIRPRTHVSLYDSLGIRGISDQTPIHFSGSSSENTIRHKLTFYADYGGQTNSQKTVWSPTFNNRQRNTMSNLWDCSAAWVGEASARIGELGKVDDLWFAATDETNPKTPAASGSMVCGAPLTQGNNDFICVGAGLVVPWDGSVPRVDFSSTLQKPKVAAFDYTAFEQQDEEFTREPFDAVEFNPYRVVENAPNLESSGSVDRHRYQVRYPYNRGRRKPRGAKFIEE